MSEELNLVADLAVILIAAGVFYYIFNFIVAFIMERIERKLNYYR